MDSLPSPNIVKVTKLKRMVGRHIACMEQMRNVYKILSRNFEGRTTRGWEDNIKIYLKEIVLKVWRGSFWLGTGTGGWLL
jgi:hypothetical protein